MKKFGFLLLLFVFMWAVPGYGHAASSGTQIYLDDQQLSVPSGAKAQVIGGSTMVPLRVISENLGYDVTWKQQARTITIEKDSTLIRMIIGSKTATVNGSDISLDASPLLRSNYALVPLRFIGEQMGLDVKWDSSSKSVKLYTRSSGSGNGEFTPPKSGNNSTGTGSVTAPTNNANSGVTQVQGISFSQNRLTITTASAVKPKAFTMTGPDRVVVDLPATAFADNFGDQQKLDSSLNGSLDIENEADVSGIRYALFQKEPSTVRVVIDLKHAMNYTAYNDGSNRVIVDLASKDSVNTTPDATLPDGSQPDDTQTSPTNSNGKKVVVIDAGHGAKDSGAVGVSRKNYEKTFNLAMALKVESILKQNPKLEVVLTRSDDTFLELKQRVKVAENLNANVFVSIHANSSGSSASNGTETYYQRSASKAFANVMHKYFAPATGLTDRGIRYGNFHVIRETTMPAVLLEVGYLSNAKEEATLFDEDFQNRVAQGIADGITEYLDVK
ncbi:N-acetylmuramoyl-L-alanine amidase family protein [Paenibacillus sp. SEL3]|uniref:N-acetylmuramoyl-L-alanine amidase family protein n=1 Tax=Paenibacillus sp. FSL L8-0689 TaxID=2921607 RepID=UPI0030F5D947